MVRLALALALLLAVRPGQLLAQDTSVDSAAVQEVRLTDGSTLYGWVLDDGDPVRFRLLSGDVLELSRLQVVSIHPARGRVVKGAFWKEDPNVTRLFFGPTGRGLRRGRGYFAAYELFMPFLGVAVTDNLVLAGGTLMFGGMDGHRPFWLAPKLRVFAGDATDVAVGALVYAVDDESLGVLYGVATRGSPDRSLSMGLGYGFVNGDLGDRPAVMAGFDVRVSKSVKLLSENYLFPGGVGLLSIGPRFFGERLSADVGLGVIFDGEGESFTFPIVNFVYAW
ncbi:MAG: hypothetical protein Q8N53_04535 [Longimicrobiales bacterium]|nr:hypothetical protein [Longimicrobiales bacterium]